MFNIGDTVRYKNQDCYKGSIGTILAETRDYGSRAYDVHWETGSLVEAQEHYNGGKFYPVWTRDLELAYKEIPYDPNQQGDTEDDI